MLCRNAVYPAAAADCVRFRTPQEPLPPAVAPPLSRPLSPWLMPRTGAAGRSQAVRSAAFDCLDCRVRDGAKSATQAPPAPPRTRARRARAQKRSEGRAGRAGRRAWSGAATTCSPPTGPAARERACQGGPAARHNSRHRRQTRGACEGRLVLLPHRQPPRVAMHQNGIGGGGALAAGSFPSRVDPGDAWGPTPGISGSRFSGSCRDRPMFAPAS